MSVEDICLTGGTHVIAGVKKSAITTFIESNLPVRRFQVGGSEFSLFLD